MWEDVGEYVTNFLSKSPIWHCWCFPRDCSLMAVRPATSCSCSLMAVRPATSCSWRQCTLYTDTSVANAGSWPGRVGHAEAVTYGIMPAFRQIYGSRSGVVEMGPAIGGETIQRPKSVRSMLLKLLKFFSKVLIADLRWNSERFLPGEVLIADLWWNSERFLPGDLHEIRSGSCLAICTN